MLVQTNRRPNRKRTPKQIVRRQNKQTKEEEDSKTDSTKTEQANQKEIDVDTRRRKLKSKEAEDLSTKKETEVLGTKGGKSEGSHKEGENTTKVDAKSKKEDETIKESRRHFRTKQCYQFIR